MGVRVLRGVLWSTAGGTPERDLILKAREFESKENLFKRKRIQKHQYCRQFQEEYF